MRITVPDGPGPADSRPTAASPPGLAGARARGALVRPGAAGPGARRPAGRVPRRRTPDASPALEPPTPDYRNDHDPVPGGVPVPRRTDMDHMACAPGVCEDPDCVPDNLCDVPDDPGRDDVPHAPDSP